LPQFTGDLNYKLTSMIENERVSTSYNLGLS